MIALVYDSSAHVVTDHPEPVARRGWAVLRMRLAGVCRTDIEITRGYMGFRGVLGHEFVAEVVECDYPDWVGKRVVGEINAACGSCEACAAGLGRHCPSRTVLGILNHDGCLAERFALPTTNLHEVPNALSDEQAVFTEPLAAAYEILEQVDLPAAARCLVLGDGKLGILCAWVLGTAFPNVTLVGKHHEKLSAAEWGPVRTLLTDSQAVAGADLVVEATGTAAGFAKALSLCRPRGTILLKSTIATDEGMNLALLVVNEVTVVGSRCGPFDRALDGLARYQFPVERLISAEFPLARADEALDYAGERGVLKVLVRGTR